MEYEVVTKNAVGQLVAKQDFDKAKLGENYTTELAESL